LTELLAETKYSFSTHPDFEYPLSDRQSERYINIFLRGEGMPPFLDEEQAQLWMHYKEDGEAFLSDEANRRYPFYDAVRADYQNRYEINS